MSAETLARLFEPFFSTKMPGEGTGLGLAVAHGIIKQYGGRFEVHSTPGEGSRFRLLLPGSVISTAVVPVTLPETNLKSGAGRVLLGHHHDDANHESTEGREVCFRAFLDPRYGWGVAERTVREHRDRRGAESTIDRRNDKVSSNDSP